MEEASGLAGEYLMMPRALDDHVCLKLESNHDSQQMETHNHGKKSDVNGVFQ